MPKQPPHLIATEQLHTELDWSAYDSYGAGDAYAQLPANGGAYGKAASVCIGNRQCQRSGNAVMCPSYRITGDPKHSTRHRAATLKAALNGEFGPNPFIGPELEAAMELCVSCKGCKRECPNGVDMSLLRTEYLAQRWNRIGKVPLRERLIAGLPRYVKWLKYGNWLLSLRNRSARLSGFIERRFGIAAERSLPKVGKSFLSDASIADDQSQNGREVLLLVDTFSNHFDPAIATATLEVLRFAGYRVHLARPKSGRPLCCGRSFISNGLVSQARIEALRTIEALWPFVERGLPVIGIEPSCLLMLRDEYYSLGLGEQVEKIAKSALLFEEFLAKEHDSGRLQLELQPIDLTYALVHGHCHQKAFGAIKAMRKVLALVPELKVEFIDSSCCGMAGSFGLEAEHYQASMQMAQLSLLPQLRQAPPGTMVIANGTSCRHQIRDGANIEALHLAQVLQLALPPRANGAAVTNRPERG